MMLVKSILLCLSAIQTVQASSVRIEASNQARPFSRFILKSDNSDKTCEDVTLVPSSGNVRYLEDCPGVLVSDRPQQASNASFHWESPSCGCVIFRAIVFDDTTSQSTNLQLTVCPYSPDLDNYLNTLLHEIDPEGYNFTNERDSNFENEYDDGLFEDEDFDEGITDVNYSDKHPVVGDPKILCQEFQDLRGAGMSPLLRRRWWRCCKRAGGKLKRCIARTIPAYARTKLRVCSVCQAFKRKAMTSSPSEMSAMTTVFSAGSCCRIKRPNRQVRCFQKVKMQSIDKFCDGLIQAPFFLPKSVRKQFQQSGLSKTQYIHPCCADEGKYRYDCFSREHEEGAASQKNPLILTASPGERLCALAKRKEAKFPGLRSCCKVEDIHNKVMCLGRVVRAGFDDKCQRRQFWARKKSALGQGVIGKRITECCEATGEARFQCFVTSGDKLTTSQVQSEISVILRVTFGEKNAASHEVSSKKESYASESPPGTKESDVSGDAFAEPQDGTNEDKQFKFSLFSAEVKDAKSQNKRHCQEGGRDIRRTRHELRILNRLCGNRSTNTSNDEELDTRNHLVKCCAFSGRAQRMKCLRSARDEKYAATCRGELTPLAVRLGGAVGDDNPCCREEEREERSCCFKELLRTKEKLLDRRAPMLAHIESLTSDSRRQVEPTRMDRLCTAMEGLPKKDFNDTVFQCCRNEGKRRYRCLTQFSRAYVDKVCSGQDMDTAYQIGYLGEIRDLNLEHACCQLEGRERYRCVLSADKNHGEPNDINVQSRERTPKTLKHKRHRKRVGSWLSSAKREICKRVDEFYSEDLLQVLNVLQSALPPHHEVKEALGEEAKDQDIGEDSQDGQKERTKPRKWKPKTPSKKKTRNGGDHHSRDMNSEEESTDENRRLNNKDILGRDLDRTEMGDRVQEFSEDRVRERQGHKGKKGDRSKESRRGIKWLDTGHTRGEGRRWVKESWEGRDIDHEEEGTRQKGLDRLKSHYDRERESGRPARRQNRTSERYGSDESYYDTLGEPEEVDRKGPRRHGGRRRYFRWYERKNTTGSALFNDSSAVFGGLASCCQLDGRKFSSCLKTLQHTLLDRLCDPEIYIEMGNFSHTARKIDHCCLLQDKHRSKCFFKEKHYDDWEEEQPGPPDVVTWQEEIRFGADGETQKFAEDDDRSGHQNILKGKGAEGAKRARRSASWRVPGVTSGEWDRIPRLPNDKTRRRKHRRGKRARHHGLWSDRRIGAVCVNVVGSAALGAFGDFLDTDNSNVNSEEQGQHVTIQDVGESLRDCCVMVNEVERIDCVKRIRSRLADQKCTGIGKSGSGPQRRHLPFPASCCDVTDEDRYSCVNGERPRTTFHKKQSSRPRSDFEERSGDLWLAQAAPSADEKEPRHDIVDPVEFRSAVVFGSTDDRRGDSPRG
ncbi:uncharacterized protein LOC110973078 isoform X2 [Acanthaster planci]|uniref:Uncharacterized protein LOC110973078 isoform X2 n=1 Tax=Acanthaster planci TaxID=133434 RepID=A0A8B7XES1_ACAPL|nr:uncharacterized protein LOC110973078 isoform X2 [Acanthaster planci]